VLIAGRLRLSGRKADPVVEIEPGELNADDLAKRIYRQFSEKVEDRAFLKSVPRWIRYCSSLPRAGRG